MRILLTGVTGFVGGWLAEKLLSQGGQTLLGISRSGRWPGELAHLQGSVQLDSLDLLDRQAVKAYLQAQQPDRIFHLAGFASPFKAKDFPGDCWDNNLTATRVLYDAISELKLKPRVVFISTGLIYGEPEDLTQPSDERSPMKPDSVYSASKAAADLMSYQYSRTNDLDVIRVRLFNQIGPRQSDDYVVAKFAHQIARIEQKKQEPVIVPKGTLRNERDITDIREMVTALASLAGTGRQGEAYNAGRGEMIVVKDLVDRLIAMSDTRIEVREVSGQPTPAARANITKLRQATGWAPSIPIDQTLRDTLNYWRGVVRTEPNV